MERMSRGASRVRSAASWLDGTRDMAPFRRSRTKARVACQIASNACSGATLALLVSPATMRKNQHQLCP